MITRKQFQFNGMHIVRDCSSDRCKKSIHSHTYKVEIKVKSQYLDNAGMVLDFGLMKGHIKDIISSFDNAYSLWTKEKNDYKQLVTINNDRWIEMPCSPTAEQYAVMFYAIINEIFNKAKFNNGERDLELLSVTVHETETGYAEATYEDYINLWLDGGYDIRNIIFSPAIKKKWTDPDLWDKILSVEGIFYNPEVELLYSERK